MNISENGLEFIKKQEGFVSCPYLDQVKKWTIGIGSTFYENGMPVQEHDPCITPERAMELVHNYLKPVIQEIPKLVNKPLTQNQFDSLCSFIYNVGMGAFKSSTLLKKIQVNPKDSMIANEFEKWVRGNGRVIGALVSRRKAEAALYFQQS
jgi:lysozyme